MGCNGVLSHTPWWEPGLCSRCQVFLGWIRKQYPTGTVGTTHKLLTLACGYSVNLFHCIWLCWHVSEKEGPDRAWKGLAFWCRGAPCASLCPWWGKHGGVIVQGQKRGAWQIKTHCGVSGVGHSPAVGTPKAWRGNKDPPMRLHGKDLDIAATASATAHTMPGKAARETAEEMRAG